MKSITRSATKEELGALQIENVFMESTPTL